MLKTAKTQDEIPEQFRADAIQKKDDSWVYEVDEAVGLKANNERLLADKRKADEKLVEMEKALGGLKPEDIANTVKASKAAEEEAARKAGKYDELLAKREKELRDEYEPRVTAGADAQKKYETLTMRVNIQKGLLAADVDPLDLESVTDMLIGTGRVKFENNKIVAYDKDGDAVSAPLDTYLAGPFKSDNKKFFIGTGSNGGGANNGGKTQSAGKGARSVSATDDAGILANLDDIASGKTPVTFAQ